MVGTLVGGNSAKHKETQEAGPGGVLELIGGAGVDAEVVEAVLYSLRTPGGGRNRRRENV